MQKNLRTFIETLRKENDVIEIAAEVDPYLEIAEIHRRVIDEQGKALLFTDVRGSGVPVVTNVFGTRRRIDVPFGPKPLEFVKGAVPAAETLLPPSLGKLWGIRDLALSAAKVGTKRVSRGPVTESRQR